MLLISNIYLKNKETADNFFWRALQIFSKHGTVFLIFILSAKLLSPYDFGVYNYILAILSLLMMLGDFGISTATSKFVAEFNMTDKVKLERLLPNSLFLIISIALIVSLITVFGGSYFLGERYIFVLYALPLTFLVPITSLYDGVYRGLKRFKELSIISFLVGFFSVFFVVLLIYFYGLIGALISQVLFYLLLASVLSIKYGKFKLSVNKKIIKEIYTYASIIGVSSLSFYLYSRVDILILDYFGYVKEIGYYEIVNRFFGLLVIPFVIFAQTISPNITKYYAQGKLSLIKAKFKKYVFFTFLFAILIVFFSYLLYPYFMVLFLNDYYVPEFILMLNILLPLFVLKALSGGIVTQGFTIPTGHANLNMKILLFSGPLNVILNILLIREFGFLGVIYATFFIWLFADLILILVYYKKYLDKE